MSYSSNIPQASDPKSQSQGELLNNFIRINEWVNVDHEQLNAPVADRGKHARVTFTTNVAPGFAGSDMGFYRNTFTSGGYSTAAEQIIFRNAAGSEFPITDNGTGFAFLPSGLLLKFGNATVNPGAQTIVFPTGANIPVFTGILGTQLTLRQTSSGDIDAAVRIRTTSTTGIDVYLSARTTTGPASTFRDVQFLVIGTL